MHTSLCEWCRLSVALHRARHWPAPCWGGLSCEVCGEGEGAALPFCPRATCLAWMKRAGPPRRPDGVRPLNTDPGIAAP